VEYDGQGNNVSLVQVIIGSKHMLFVYLMSNLIALFFLIMYKMADGRKVMS
jgi:hypothetical protein